MKLMFYLSRRGDKFDFVVDLFSGMYGYSHCELFFSDGMSFSSSPREGGCRFKNITYDDKWVMVDLPFTPSIEHNMRTVCEKYDGKKYDWIGIFLTFLIPAHVEDGSRWWCSEICGKVVGVDDYKISPNKLAKRFNLPRQKLHIPLLEVKLPCPA